MNDPQDRLAALGGSMRDFRYLPGANLLGRVQAFFEWQELRRKSGLWPLGPVDRDRAPQQVPGADGRRRACSKASTSPPRII